MKVTTSTMESMDYLAMTQALMDILFENDKLGEYDILIAPWYFRQSEVGDPRAIRVRVNVVFKENKKFRMSVIVVEVNGKYQDFYYNESDGYWKELSEPEDYTIQSWWDEEQLSMPGPKVPAFLEGKYADGAVILEDLEMDAISITK